MKTDFLKILLLVFFFIFAGCDNSGKKSEKILQDTTKVRSAESPSTRVDSGFALKDSILTAVGIIQSSGFVSESNPEIAAEYQLITYKKPIFLFSDNDLTNYWGKCVQVQGVFPKGWDLNTEEVNGRWLYGRTAIEVMSISLIPANTCDALLKSEFLNTRSTQDTVFGVIKRQVRPAPDISYDYAIALKTPIPHPEEPTILLENIPVILQMNLEEINDIIESKKEVTAIGHLSAGYAETRVFIVNKLVYNE